MTIGIYKITCIANNRFYIGSSKNIEIRFSKHKSQLKYNRHENLHIQRAYNKYGKDVFIYEIVEIVKDADLLLSIEQQYLNTLFPEFNIGKCASGGDNLTNHPNREDIIRRISAGVKKRMKDPKIRQHYSDMFTGDGNPNWKGGKTFCGCGNRMAVDSKTCGACRDWNGENNPFYGKHHSDKTKEKISKSRNGVLPVNTKPISINGKTYMSQAQAARDLGVSSALITYRLNKQYDGYVRLPLAS